MKFPASSVISGAAWRLGVSLVVPSRALLAQERK